MANTTKGFPYPIDTDEADVPSDVQLLAEAVDAAPGIASLSQSQIDALGAAQKWAGRVVWNQTANKLQRSDGSTFADVGSPLSSTNPLALGTAAPGTSATVSREDHVHPLPTAAGIGAIPAAMVTAKGDLLAATGSGTVVRIPIGTNGQALVADSTQSSGIKWADPAALGNLDGGDPSSVYGGTTNIDAGGVS